MNTMTAGAKSKIRWRVDNILRWDYGLQSTVHRPISVRFRRLSGEIETNHLSIETSEVASQNLESVFIQSIGLVQEKMQVLIEGTIHLNESVLPSMKTVLRMGLYFGKLNKYDEEQPIQYLDLSISAAQIYSKTVDSAVLLVTNHGTTAPELLPGENSARSSI